jgi:[acyl-carrier-protein] S-malonyltransferase
MEATDLLVGGHPMAEEHNTFEAAAFAFRGYNVTNLGKTPELLAHVAYGPTVERWLREASAICADAIHRPVNLVERVRLRQETSLDTYAEAVALTVAAELAQLQLLHDFFEFSYRSAKLAFGYSLGEIAALAASGLFDMAEALKVPLAMASDAAFLAHDATLGVLFSRGPAIDITKVQRLCLEINAEGRGVIGVSSYLAPNSLLLIGQGETLDRFIALIPGQFPERLYLRKNEHRWPPMHTPIVWQRSIRDRAATMLHTVRLKHAAPIPPVFSLVTANISYDEINTRTILTDWVDHPQHLWDAVCETLVLNIRTVIHVGAEPNLIPATFKRLSDNVQAQTGAKTWGGRRLRFVSRAARRPWLAKLLPRQSTLLRAPYVKQIVLEDWLLEQKVPM